MPSVVCTAYRVILVIAFPLPALCFYSGLRSGGRNEEGHEGNEDLEEEVHNDEEKVG